MPDGPAFDNLPSADMHIHTVHCGHAAPDMTLENIVGRAQQLGLNQIAITEHVWNNQQLTTMELLRREFERLNPAITVRLGAEVDLDPRYSDGRLIEQVSDCFRPLIVATHAYPQSNVMWYEDAHISKRAKRRLLKNWFGWITAAFKRQKVDILAHPGVMVSREGPHLKFEAEILDRFADLFGVMRAHEVSFEMNEHVKRKLSGPAQLETYHHLPALAAQIGVKFSLGSDSHQLDQVGQLNWVSSLARKAGLRPTDFSLYDGPGLIKKSPEA